MVKFPFPPRRAAPEGPADDTTLVNRFVSGHQDAFADLMRRHWTMVYWIAYGVLQSSDDAEDAAQDAFVSAARSLTSTFRMGEPVVPWLARIALNAAIDRNGQRTRWQRVDGGGQSRLDTADTRFQPEAAIQRVHIRRRLDAAIRNLSEKNQTVFIYRVLMDRSVRETAQALEWSEAKVKTQLHRALTALREELQDVDT